MGVMNRIEYWRAKIKIAEEFWKQEKESANG
jgi:hypothetical protein